MRRKIVRRITHSRAFQSALGTGGAHYLRLVWATSRVILEPPDVYELIEPDLPIILAMCQHFMVPFLQQDHPKHRAKVLISRHRDAEINAIAAEKLGIGTGGPATRACGLTAKGGSALVAMLDALGRIYGLMTADVKDCAGCRRGIVRRCRAGAPLVSIAFATSQQVELKTWDRAAGLPFGISQSSADRSSSTVKLTRRPSSNAAPGRGGPQCGHQTRLCDRRRNGRGS
jgi:lysophospholipid acyltransferase (LPLAT)-like uncharacterized protein